MTKAVSASLKVAFLLALIAGFLLLITGGMNRYRQILHIGSTPNSKWFKWREVQAMQKSGATVLLNGKPLQPSSEVPGSTEALAVPPPAPRFIKLMGYWDGRSVLGNRGLCILHLELRRAPESHFSGFSTLECLPLYTPGDKAPPVAPLNLQMLGHMNPSSAILSGTVDADSIKFHADKIIDAAGDGCIMGSFTVTPFGVNQIATVWDDKPCMGGQMVLTRTTQ
jgi:hypothetical protein